MNKKGESKLKWGFIIFIIIVIVIVVVSLIQNEPIHLEVNKVCFQGFCVVGDFLHIDVCLSSIDRTTKTVEIESDAISGGRFEYNASECSSQNEQTIKVPLRSDLENKDYELRIKTTPIENVGLLLDFGRWLKGFFIPLDKSNSYYHEEKFKPTYPLVKIKFINPNCDKSLISVSFEEIQIRLDKEDINEEYNCKVLVRTRRYVKTDSDLLTITKQSEDEDVTIFESKFFPVDKKIGYSLLYIKFYPSSSIDYYNIDVIPVCIVNNNEIHVVTGMNSIKRCPSKD